MGATCPNYGNNSEIHQVAQNISIDSMFIVTTFPDIEKNMIAFDIYRFQYIFSAAGLKMGLADCVAKSLQFLVV